MLLGIRRHIFDREVDVIMRHLHPYITNVSAESLVAKKKNVIKGYMTLYTELTLSVTYGQGIYGHVPCQESE